MSTARIRRLVCDPKAVAQHNFWPLVGFVRRERRRKKGLSRWRVKSRPIAYASHADAHIYSYYSWKLSPLYEERLRSLGLTECVLAYRSDQGKANYHFASESFAAIACRESCDAVAIDVEKFFDSIPHGELKKQWKGLLGIAELPPDHYQVFKSVTKFAVVPLAQARKAAGVGRRQVDALRRIPIKPSEFDKKIRRARLINVNGKKAGIPQGLPISGMLANLVMLGVDIALCDMCKECDGLYRRYSDDILIVAPPGETAKLEALLSERLEELGPKYQESKTVRRRFRRTESGSLACVQMSGEADGVPKPLQYLGFDFDGQRVSLRPQTVARFGKRMVRAVKRAKNAARRAAKAGAPIRIRRRSLYARFTHLRPHRETPLAARPRGSFFVYAKASHSAFDNAKFEFENQIVKQLRRQWDRLQAMIRTAEGELQQELAGKGNSPKT